MRAVALLLTVSSAVLLCVQSAVSQTVTDAPVRVEPTVRSDSHALQLGPPHTSRFRMSPEGEKTGGPSVLGSNAEGTHFVVGFMQNETEQSKRNFYQYSIQITSRFATHVTIAPADGSTPTQLDLAPFELQTVIVPEYFECIGEGVFKKGIDIASDLPISVYCYNGREQTSDGYLALPVKAWGTRYVTVNYNVDHYAPIQWPPRPTWRDTLVNELQVEPRHGEFAIIAFEDSTVVHVTPRVTTLGGVYAGTVATRVLDRGDVFQVQDGDNVRGRMDISGSKVVAEKPVGVLTGHVRAAIPYTYESKDHLVEMLPPINELGKRYFVIPFGGRHGGDRIRIVPIDDVPIGFTLSSTNGRFVSATTALNSIYEDTITAPTTITATRPVLVAHYSQSAGTDDRNANVAPGGALPVPFDPYLILTTPEEQFVNAAVFQTMPDYPLTPGYAENNGRQFNHHFFTIVSEKDGFDRTTINAQPINTYAGFVTGDIPGTKYVWATVELPDGEMYVVKGDALFGGYVYGIGEFDSYGWPVGAGLRKFDIPDDIDPKLTVREVCGGMQVFAADSGFTESGLRDVWLDSANSTNITFTKTLLIVGDEMSLGTARLSDPKQDGHAVIIAEDLQGNRTTVEFDLKTIAPTFSAEDIDFGLQDIGVTVNQKVTIANPSDGTMVIDSAYLARGGAGGFVLQPQPRNVSLSKNGTLDVTVYFSSSSRGEFRDTVVLVSSCIEYRVPLHAVIPYPIIATHDLDFGRVRVGRTRDLTLRVWNEGQAELVIDSAVLVHLAAPAYTTPFVTPFPAPVRLAPGEDTSFAVTFAPTAKVDYPAEIRFYSNAETDTASHIIGRGVMPALAVLGHDYGKLLIGHDSTWAVPIMNISGPDYGDTATVTGLRLEDPRGFTPDASVFKPSGQLLPPGDTMWVPTTFAPDAERAFVTAAFAENADGIDDPYDTLRGSGFQVQATIEGCDWMRQWVGTSHDSLRYVRNTGHEPIRIDTVEIVSGDLSEFRITQEIAEPVVLAPGDSLPVYLQFSPLEPGQRSATIQARTSSEIQPVIQAELLGFGLEAGAIDESVFDESPAFSCEVRHGRIEILNTGNTDLTFEGRIGLSAPTGGIVTFLAAPQPGETLAAGETQQIEFDVDFNGVDGPTQFEISWQFAEIPGVFHHAYTLESHPQVNVISATATGEAMGPGDEFDLDVVVDDVVWKHLPQQQVEMRLEFNPTTARFDQKEFERRAINDDGMWKAVDESVNLDAGVVVLRFEPRDSNRSWLDGYEFLPIPFHAFVGDNKRDTFQVTLTASGNGCTAASEATVPYEVSKICGLQERLFEYTGPFALRQNHPNPVSSKTAIEFTLGFEAPARLELYRADGTLVRTLVDGVLAAGDHSVVLDVSELSSGRYYYRLTSGAFTQALPMSVMK